MKLPRDMSGEKLASLLHRRYKYQFVRQRGSHMTVVLGSVDISRHSAFRSQSGVKRGI